MNGNIWVFDTETTDVDDDREVIEAAALIIEREKDLSGSSDRIVMPLQYTNSFEQRYKPSKEISFGSLAVHHILPSELRNCPPSSTCQVADDVDYLIGHSIDFDWEAVGKPDVKRIDTYAIAKWLWIDADSYSQSALVYMLYGPNEATRRLLRDAHSALTDVENCFRLLKAILNRKPSINTWSALHDFSEACRIPRVMPIGKNQGVYGMTLEDAVKADWGFCQWALNQDWLDQYLRTGLENLMHQ